MSKQGTLGQKFQRAAKQRLDAASFLANGGFYLDAVYIAGYVVELALKALILGRTSAGKYDTMLIRLTKVGSKGHSFEYLKSILKGPAIDCVPPAHVNEGLRRVSSWSSELRYEVGRLACREAKAFLDAAKLIQEWSERCL
jgi:HEPN domain-containing protein